MKFFWFIILVPTILLAQDFEFTMEWDSIEVEIEGYQLPAPWTGGYERTQLDLTDIDNDSDFDLFINDWRYLNFFSNEGDSINSDFKFLSTTYYDIIALSHAWASPEFCDIDADGDSDLILGSGYVGLYVNIGTPESPIFIEDGITLWDTDGNPVFGTTVALVDIDSDDDYDLFGGEYQGHIQFYRNIGTPDSCSWYLEDDFWLSINVYDDADITFCDIDSDSDYDLIIGDEDGYLWYVQNEGTPQQYDFAAPVQSWLGIDVGDNASPEFCDIDGDGDYDMFVGIDAYTFTSDPGDVFFYENIGTPQNPQFQEVARNYLTLDAGTINIPIIVDFDLDSDLDLLYSSKYKLTYFENIGSLSDPFFSLVSDDLMNGDPPYAFDLYDLDVDGDLDMLSANGSIGSGEILLYANRGTATQPQFVYSYSIFTPYYSIGMPDLVDIDADGDADLLLNIGSDIAFYENQGTPQVPNFVFNTEEFAGLIYGRNGHFIDMDGDGDYDFPCGYNTWGIVELYKNIGTIYEANFILWEGDLLGYDTFYGPLPCGGDIDNDGDIDMFVGEYSGGIRFFRNITDTSSIPPLYQKCPYPAIHINFGPNPANPTTWITFNLPYPQKATLAVYNLLGQKVTTLAQGLQPPGMRTVYWNSSQVSSGVYLIKMETEIGKTVKRLAVLK